MNCTLRQLAVFTEICEQKASQDAAKDVYMTQPVAYIQLRNFQDQFDIPLIEIIGRQLFVTSFSEEIYSASMNILVEANQTE